MKLTTILLGVGALYLLTRAASSTGSASAATSSPSPQSGPPAPDPLLKLTRDNKGITSFKPLNTAEEGTAFGVALAQAGIKIPMGQPLIQVASPAASVAANAAYWANIR